MSWLGSPPSSGSAGRARRRPAGGHVEEPPGNDPIRYESLNLSERGDCLVLRPRLAYYR